MMLTFDVPVYYLRRYFRCHTKITQGVENFPRYQ